MVTATTINEIFTKSVQKAASKTAQDANLKKACSDFESIFLHYILKSARNTLPENELFESTRESKMYKSMLDEELAVSIAGGGGTGLGRMLYEELAAPLGAGRYREPTRHFSEGAFEPIKTLIEGGETGETDGQSDQNH